VHYAGNLQIAASVMLTLGLVFALVLSLFTTVLGLAAPSESARHHDHDRHQQEGVSTSKEASEETREHSNPSRRTWTRSTATPYVVALLLACLYAGSALQILAQYFGVLGLTVNATPTYGTAQSFQKNATLGFYVADSWAIGKGLSTYATTAWASATFCAAVATTVFRRPRFPKLL
jgi:hypothetical protein